MHVVLLAWAFPPSRAAGVYRPLAMANLLAERGVDVTVVTASEETFLVLFGADPGLTAAIDPRVSLVRVPQAPANLWPIINDWTLPRAEDPAAWWTRAARSLDEVFPEATYVDWIVPAGHALDDLHRSQPIDLLVATAAPYVSFEVAARFHELSGVPYVLDDRDSFAFNVFTGGTRGQADRTGQLMRQFESCLEYWVVNPPIAAHTATRFPAFADRMHTVENGWDRRFLEPSCLQESPAGRQAGFVGTITKGFPAADLAAVWQRFHETGPPDTVLRVAGDVGQRESRTALRGNIETLANSVGVDLMGRFQKTGLHQLYAELDVLVFVKEGGRFVTSGKVYEYMATGKPIVALCSAELDAMRVLADYPRLWHAEITDHGHAAQQLAAAFAALGDGGMDRAREYGVRYERRQLLRPHLDRLLAVVPA